MKYKGIYKGVGSLYLQKHKDPFMLSTRLQEAAVHVVYGVVGYKTHAKMCLILRKEGKKLRNYFHLGTGNYHPKMARLYTDYGFIFLRF